MKDLLPVWDEDGEVIGYVKKSEKGVQPPPAMTPLDPFEKFNPYNPQQIGPYYPTKPSPFYYGGPQCSRNQPCK